MSDQSFLERIADRSVGRYDTSALATDGETLEAVTQALAAPHEASDEHCDLVAGIDALGFVYGAALARHIETGFVPIRKGGKLPLADGELCTGVATDYTGTEKALALDCHAIDDGQRVLLVDDWIETAAQMGLAVDLVERAGGVVLGISVLGADVTDASGRLDERYGLHTLELE